MEEVFTYVLDELFDQLDEIEFDEEPDGTSRAELKLRELYDLPNVGRDLTVLMAVAEYTEREAGAEFLLGDFETYAKLFVQFFDNWTAFADDWLREHFGEEIRVLGKFLDADGFGQWVGKDEGGYIEVSDGRIAYFNKKEGA